MRTGLLKIQRAKKTFYEDRVSLREADRPGCQSPSDWRQPGGLLKHAMPLYNYCRGANAFATLVSGFYDLL
jgi:hypothetical protein